MCHELHKNNVPHILFPVLVLKSNFIRHCLVIYNVEQNGLLRLANEEETLEGRGGLKLIH